MRGLPCWSKIISIPWWGIECAVEKAIRGGGVEIAQPGVENGCNTGAVTMLHHIVTARQAEIDTKMLEMR
ncbi:MAG TPA: hypothetical protein VEI45_10935 [Mycobacterium sp.]|uniref:hypothetical protein n=1 Tax=Mycobacterium sp. TaxID=1785 RepID=UPI002D4C51FE|nr:hypothetical protein [Mycobacterium sp.]HXY64837.1 hypothetical protein [Mycobacterium sp.]